MTPTLPMLARRLYAATGFAGRLVRHSQTVWSSATMTGAKDTFVFRFDGVGKRVTANLLAKTVDAGDITVPDLLMVDLTAEVREKEPGVFDVTVCALTMDESAPSCRACDGAGCRHCDRDASYGERAA